MWKKISGGRRNRKRLLSVKAEKPIQKPVNSHLDSFVALSDIVMVCPGGIGTLLELSYTWQLVQVEHLCETPIILFGEMWSGLLGWLKNEVLSRDLFTPQDMNSIFHLTSPTAVVSLVKKIQDDRSKVEHVCHNFQKYRVEFNPSETD